MNQQPIQSKVNAIRTAFFFIFIVLYSAILMTGCRKDFDITTNADATVEDHLSNGSLATQPNILFIVMDDIGYEILSCNGSQTYQTPNIDKIAKNGIRFTQAHSSPLCAPSRITLLTGKYNFRNYTQWGYLNPLEKTIGNMFSDNGYATCYTGKWQLDGGNASIRAFGWQRYSAWLPFNYPGGDERLEGSRYKSARAYQDGGYLPDTATLNKYSDDFFTSYLFRFIDSVRLTGKSFFAYHSLILSHQPFCPTPDDPEYATWNYSSYAGDKRFHNSMITYMDKKIGEILTFLGTKKMLQNTVIVLVGDNGTPSPITSTWNGISVTGGKGTTYETGTNVPLLIAGLGRFVKNKTSNILVDFTDMLPTLAEIAQIPVPGNYGTLDGTSFYPILVNGDSSQLRTTIYNSFAIQPVLNNAPWTRWVQNTTYKVYDTNRYRSNYQMVKIEKGKTDSAPITNPTQEEIDLKQSFIQILRNYVP